METVTEKPDTSKRHPDFDAAWDKYGALVWWYARRIGKAFGRPPSHIIGTLVLRMNYVLYHLDESKGTFGNMLSLNLYRWVYERVMRYESEAWHVAYMKQYSDREHWQQCKISYNYHEHTDYFLYRPPEMDSDEIAEIIGSFETPQDCWNFMMRGVEPRRRWILEQRFRENRSLGDIGQQMRVSKERVRQLINHALSQIAKRLQAVRAFTTLFGE
jgi:hypothetical protein